MNLNSQNHKQNIDSYLLPRRKDYFEKIYKFLNEQNIKKVWDIGCASGDFAFFAPSSIDFLATDYSAELIEIAKKTRSKINIEFKYDDICSSNIRKKFDVVSILGAITTFKDPSIVIKKMCESSSKYVIIQAPFNMDSFDTLVSHKYWTEDSDKYQNSFNIFAIETIENLLSQNQFKIINVEEYVMDSNLKKIKDNRLINYHANLDGKKILMNQLGIVLSEQIITAKLI